jgi:hypothetical protein
MKIEWWDSGVDFYVVTPFYVVSNLYKRKSGTIIAPMPIELVKGTLAQLGKKYLWQVMLYRSCATLMSLTLLTCRVTVTGSMDSFRTSVFIIGEQSRETVK